MERAHTLHREPVPGALRRRSALSLVLVGGAALVSACLTPPPRSAEDAEQADGPKSVAEQIEALELVPVVPDGALIWDGANISLKNIDPGGSWYAFNDATPGGEMTPPSVDTFEDYLDGGRIHTTGKGFREWGGGIGMNFVGSPMLTPVDATKYKGIEFKASGEGWVHVGLGTVATMPEFDICNMEGKKCYDHFAVDIKLTEEEKTYEFTWDQLRQAGWGYPQTELDPATIVALTFTSRGASPWDFTIDDVAFIE